MEESWLDEAFNSWGSVLDSIAFLKVDGSQHPMLSIGYTQLTGGIIPTATTGGTFGLWSSNPLSNSAAIRLLDSVHRPANFKLFATRENFIHAVQNELGNILGVSDYPVATSGPGNTTTIFDTSKFPAYGQIAINDLDASMMRQAYGESTCASYYSPAARAANLAADVLDGAAYLESIKAPATSSSDPTSRLANLSVVSTMAAGQTLTVGLYINGGARNILLRAGGPALAALGYPGTMDDPRLELFQGATSVFTNDSWDPVLAPVFPSLGAFGYPLGSKDAAFLRSLSGSYSMQIKGTGPGLVLVEAYDAGTGNATRMTNISALSRSGLGSEALAAGFNITGTGTKRLLIRGVGPTLGKAPYLADPKIEVFVAGSSTKVAENDNWDPALASTFTSVAAFALTPGSKDAALIATLAPGTYSVRVTGSDGGTGDALIEVYELP